MNNAIKKYVYVIGIMSFMTQVQAASDTYDFVGNLLINSTPLQQLFVEEQDTALLKAAEATYAEQRAIYWNLWKDIWSDKSTSMILDEKTIVGLELVDVKGETRGSLLGKINPITQGGLCYTGHALTSPSCDYDTIKNRQDAVMYLSNHNDIRQEIFVQLQKIRGAEARLMSFFGTEHSANTQLFEKVSWGKRFNGCNTNASALGSLHATRFLRSLTKMIWSFDFRYLFALPSGLYGAYPLYQEEGLLASLKEAFIKPIGIAYEGMINTPYQLKTVYDIMRTGQIIQDNGQVMSLDNPGAYVGFGIGAGISIAISAYAAYRSYKAYKFEKECHECTTYMHTQVSAAAHYIQAIKELTVIIDQHPQLRSALTCYTALPALLAKEACSMECAYFIDLLQSETFNGDASVCMHTGRVVAAYNLAWRVMPELGSALQALSELDAYTAVAHMYLENNVQEKAQYTKVDFVKESNNPLINAQEFWNPLLDCHSAITNNLSFGDSNPSALVVTGINRGGKSTIFKAIALNSILAQAFGIAAATSWIATVLSMVNCYIDVQGDIQQGISQFQAEIARVSELAQAIMSVKRDHYALILCDELFTGTEPVAASRATCTFAEQCAMVQNLLSVFISHYKEVAEVAEQKAELFTNYSVVAHEQSDGSFNPIYKIQLGKSEQNDAHYMLQQAGIV